MQICQIVDDSILNLNKQIVFAHRDYSKWWLRYTVQLPQCQQTTTKLSEMFIQQFNTNNYAVRHDPYLDGICIPSLLLFGGCPRREATWMQNMQ